MALFSSIYNLSVFRNFDINIPYIATASFSDNDSTRSTTTATSN